MQQIIEKIKSEFTNLDFLARILLATPNELFIKSLAKAILSTNSEEIENITNLKVPEVEIIVKHINIIYINFSGIDLKERGIPEGPLVAKNNSDF